MFFARFWGVRGSIPCPGKNTVEFGGNTSCIEIRAGEKVVIIDAGSGLKDLGNYLLSHDMKKAPLNADIFLTHTHLDHIIGFPMFAPLFVPGTRLRIWGPVLPHEKSLESVLGNLMSYEYWPLKLSELSADLSFEQIRETTLDLGSGLSVTTKYLNHSLVSLGYRFEYCGKSIASLYDNEPFEDLFADFRESGSFYNEDAALNSTGIAEIEQEKLAGFYQHADIFICDSQYTRDEYENGRQHRGHSTDQQALLLARKAQVKKLVLFHHDPARTDKELRAVEKNNRGSVGLQIMAAKEGMIVEA
jgi:phosphoribosyl 1,2-cyclic phosphodiesterase